MFTSYIKEAFGKTQATFVYNGNGSFIIVVKDSDYITVEDILRLFSLRLDERDVHREVCIQYRVGIAEAIKEIHAKGQEATAKDKSKQTVLEIIVEFYARGFKFVPIDLYKSDSKKFQITPEGLLPPFSSLQGLGVNAAQSIVEGRKAGEFKTLEELKERTSLGRSLIDMLKENGVLDGIPETNQLTLF